MEPGAGHSECCGIISSGDMTDDFNFNDSADSAHDAHARQTEDQLYEQSPTTGEARASVNARRANPPGAYAACKSCRVGHIKCGGDGVNPCAPCIEKKKKKKNAYVVCEYEPSRRGGQNKLPVANSHGSLGLDREVQKYTVSGLYPKPAPANVSLPGSVYQDRDMSCFDLYYAKFNNAHPFLLPKDEMALRIRYHPDTVRQLIPVIDYIGSRYITSVEAGPLKCLALAAIEGKSLPKNGFSVQALLLVAIASQLDDDDNDAQNILGQASAMAQELKMHTKLYAALHGGDDPLLRESWRRTFWGLYCTQALFAGIRQDVRYQFADLPDIGAELPCEESDYETKVCSISPYIHHFTNSA